MKYHSTLYKESLEESSVITVNDKYLGLIEDDNKQSIQKSIDKVKAFKNSLDEKDYDHQTMLNEMVDATIKDPEHNHEYKFDGEDVIEVIIDRKFRPSSIVLADFECSTDEKIHKEY